VADRHCSRPERELRNRRAQLGDEGLGTSVAFLETRAERDQLAFLARERCGCRGGRLRKRVETLGDDVHIRRDRVDPALGGCRGPLGGERGDGLAQIGDVRVRAAPAQVVDERLDPSSAGFELAPELGDLTVLAGKRCGSRIHRSGKRREAISEDVDAVRDPRLELRVVLRPCFERFGELLQRFRVSGDRGRTELGLEVRHPGCERVDPRVERVTFRPGTLEPSALEFCAHPLPRSARCRAKRGRQWATNPGEATSAAVILTTRIGAREQRLAHPSQ